MQVEIGSRSFGVPFSSARSAAIFYDLQIRELVEDAWHLQSNSQI